MAKSSSKAWRIRIGSLSYVCREAAAILDDSDSGGGYNHPALWLTFARTVDGHDDKVTIQVRYQRNRPRPEDKFFRPAQYRMDTCQRWSESYGGKIELDRGSHVDIGSSYSLDAEDQLRVKVAGQIAATIREYNLGHVHSDEFPAAVAAVEKLGQWVDWQYRPRYGSLCDLRTVEGTGANRKHEQAEQAAKQSREEADRAYEAEQRAAKEVA